MKVRASHPSDLETIAALWHDGWRDAHAAIVPPGLVRLRTAQDFRIRAEKHLPAMRILEIEGHVAGFCLIKGNELDQFYLAEGARGTGAASVLMDDAERLFIEAGIRDVWLACAICNAQAARFYEKRGWHRAGERAIEVETADGKFPLKIWRYEKRLDA